MAAIGRFAETAEIYRDASMLAERAGEGDALQIFFGLSVASLARGEIKAALAISDEMLGTARRLGSARALFLAHTALGNACHFHGELIEARAHFNEARQHYREEDFFGLPNHPVLNGLDFRAATEWHLGYPDRCLRYAEEQLALTTQRKDTPGDSLAYWAAGFAYRLRGD